MDESTEQGDCCPISQDDLETKGIAFGPRQVRPDSFDAFVDKESARARARMLGCIGIRQYSSTTGGTVWMPCSNESDYRRVTGQSEMSRRQRRRMLKVAFSEETETKALGSTIGIVGGRINTNPFTAIDADLDGLVLEGLPQINMGRGVPDPTPGSPVAQPFAASNDNFAVAAMSNRKPQRVADRISEPVGLEKNRRTTRPSAKLRMEQDRNDLSRSMDYDGFDDAWRKAVQDVVDSELFAERDSDEAVQNLFAGMEDLASRVASVVDEQSLPDSERSMSTRESADFSSSRLTAKVLGTVSEIMNNPPEILSGREELSRRLTSSLIESGARRVADTGGKPGVWAFLMQALLGGAIGIQGGWELLARIFGIENGTGWIPSPTGRSLEVLSPSLARQRSNEARSRALERVGRSMDALRNAGFAIAEAGDMPAVADDVAEALDGDSSVDLPGDVLPKDTTTASSLDDLIRRIREATGVSDTAKRRPRAATRAYLEEDQITRNRMDLIGIPTSILDVFDSSSVDSPTDADGSAARLITNGGTDGANGLNASFLYEALRNQSYLRDFVAPVDSPYAAQLASLIEQGRLPRLAKAVLEMSPESVEDFLAVNPRVVITAARSASKKLRPSGSWITRIDHDPFEIAAHMLRAKDYHLSAIANGFDSPDLLDAVDELVGSNASETSAIFSSLVAHNRDKLAAAYDGSVSVARSGNSLLKTARNLIANATENDSTWSSSREAISSASRAMVSGEDVSAGMASPTVRYGRNYPRRRRRSGDWSPIANKIRDSVQRYKNRYGAPAANAADLARFVDFSYPELLDESAELIDLMKEKIEFGSLKLEDYASEGWKNRDIAELALDEFDPTNLESIFDPGKKMGLLKAIGVVLSAAAKTAPSRSEQEGVMDLLDEVNSWSFTVLPTYSEPRSVTSRRRGIFPSISDDAEAGMTVNRPVTRDVRETLMSRQDPIGSGTQGTPTIRMRRKLVERANQLLTESSPDDLIDRIGMDPQGPVTDISETFLNTAEQFGWNQETMASFYEDVTEMMNRMVQDMPDESKRRRLADMFTDALEDIAENIDDENREFFSRTGDIPSRTVSRLARRTVSEDQNVGMQAPREQVETPVETEPTTTPAPTQRRPRLSDADTTTIYENVLRVVSSLNDENIANNPNTPESWREKLRAAGANVAFSSDELLDDLADTTLSSVRGDGTTAPDNPFAGVSDEAIEYLDDLLNVVLDEIGASTTGTTERFVSDLRRLAGVRDSSDFHNLIRSLSTRYGRATDDDFAEQVAENSYLTTSAIRNRIRDRFPDFYEVMDSTAFGEDVNAGMSGPTMDRLREKVVASRQIRQLGKLAAMDDAKDYRMRTTEARRRRLLSMASPGGFLDFVTKGVTDQRSPLYLRRIASNMGGLETYLKQLSDSQVDQIWNGLVDFVSRAKSSMTEGGLVSPYMIMYNAARVQAIADDPEFKPESTGRFTDEELLQKLDVNSWDDLLPSDEDMMITPSDVDAVPSVRAKAEAALEIASLDRSQLMALLTNETTRAEAQGRIAETLAGQARAAQTSRETQPGKIEYVPTPTHMEQIVVADAITPLDSESLVAFVQTLDDSQLSAIANGSVATNEARELVERESKTIAFSSAARKLFGIREMAASEPAELSYFEGVAGRLISDESISPPIANLVAAVIANDDLAASKVLSEMDPLDKENETSLVRTLWELSRNSRGTTVTALLPPSIAEAEKLASLRAKAVGVLKSQQDGGRDLARKTIDRLPKGGKGYDMVRVVPEPTEGQQKILGLAEAIRQYDGSVESAARIVYSLSDAQLERLRNNYIIPSIIQRMDRKAYEARQDQSSIAQTRARIDNLGRRLEMLTFGAEGSERTVEDVLSRVDEALIKAFGDRASEISLLTPAERQYYGDIIDYFVSGGSETFDDPSQYAYASKAMRQATAETPTDADLPPMPTDVPPNAPTPSPDQGDDFWDGMGVDAGMAAPTPPTPPTPPDGSDKRRIEPLPQDAARRIFGDDVYGWISEGTWTGGDGTFPRTAIPEEASYARKAIAALFSLQEGKSPADVAERLRSEGVYSNSQLLFQALSSRTLEAIRRMPDSPYDFPDDFYDPRADADVDRRNFFLSTMQEYLSLHMTLGGDVVPIYDDRPGRDPVRYSFDVKREDFQLQISGDDMSNWKLVYNPDQPNDTVRSDAPVPAEDEFLGDPSEHPDVQSVDRTIRALKRQFPAFRDWLNQSGRYSRILGTAHYEKDDSFGIGIIDQVLADPSSMDLDKVIRQIADQFPVRGYSDSTRLALDAANLGPDPDDVSPFPNLESYPNPDVMANFSMPKDRLAKQKKIAVSTAKASASARQSWWGMFSAGTTMDEYEIAAVSKTTDGDNFHPEAILAGLRKYARDNGISDSQFDALRSAAETAATARYNSVAIQKVAAALNDIAMNSQGGLAGELTRLDQMLRQLEKHSRELSRHYQDRLRARIQTLYSAWGTMTAAFDAERARLARELSLGRMTPQEVVDETRRLWLAMQPSAYSALNQIADLSRRARASQRARNAIEVQQQEIRTRIDEIRRAAKLTGADVNARMGMIRGLNNALSHLANDPSGLSDDTSAGMTVGRARFGLVGVERDFVPEKRELLSTKEKRFASEIAKINDLLSRVNLDDMDRIPDIRTAMSTLRGGRPDRIVPQMRFGTPAEMERAKTIAAAMMRADADAESATRQIMGARFKRFSDLALASLPDMTRRITEDAVIDGFAEAMRANGAKESDIDAALIMYSEAIRNVRNFSIFNPVATTARLFGVDEEEVSDAIATETLLAKTSNLLRMAQSYASGLSGAYGESSVRRMTTNRFPELQNLGKPYVDSVFVSASSANDQMRKLESAISLNNLMRINPRAISAAFSVSEDVAQLISASAVPRTALADLSNPLPHDWNFMTFRDRQIWLGSEEAFNSLGRMGVNDELSKLQRQIEDFGSMDGPYPALARVISGNDTTTGAFGRQLITVDGRSPMYAARGMTRSDLVRNGQNQISSLVAAVPGIEMMSDRALSRFLGAPYDVVAEFRREGTSVSPTEAERLARAFGKTSAEIWPVSEPQSDADAGNFHWLASTWDRSGEVLAALNEGADPYAIASGMQNGQFVADKVSELFNDGTIGRFYDRLGLEEITSEDAASYVASSAPRSRKGVVEILASAGYREQDIVDATGFNPNTVRNSLHELRKQGLLPEVTGSPKWIAKNGDAVIADFNSGVSKRTLMKKYGIGAKTLDSILASSAGYARMDDAYQDVSAGMANRRLPDNVRMSDGPTDDWREERPTRADGSRIDPELQTPPAVVADPFVDPTSQAAKGVDGETKDPEKMQLWSQAISSWVSMVLEGGYFRNRSADMTPGEQMLTGLFGDTGDASFENAEFELYPGAEPDGIVRGRRFKTFDIATRQENPTNEVLSLNSVPSVVRGEFTSTGVYRGIMPLLRGLLLATHDKHFNKLSQPDGDGSPSWEGVSTDDLLEAGLLDEPELPRDVNDEFKLKLWQLRQMLRNPNLVDAPPIFELGDEKVMRLLIPIMASADEQNLVRARHGAVPTGVLGDPSDAIPGSTIIGDEMWSQGNEGYLKGVPMFSNLLLGSVLSGNLEARKLVDELTPRQIMLANWVYGIYTAVEPMVNAFGEMMPTQRRRNASPNIPEEPGSESMLGDPMYLPIREVDDQVFAFAFDSIFKALQNSAEQPGLLLMEALPTEDWSNLYAPSTTEARGKANALINSTKVLARIVADVLATGIYRKAVQSLAKEDEMVSPFYRGGEETPWFRFARPRVDSYGYWSMYGPNLVYAGTGRDPYQPGWNDEINPISELGGVGSGVSQDRLESERESLRELQRLVDETPGKYWWETEAAYGELDDDQILEMHPEEFADYVSSMSMFGDGELEEAKPSQLLGRVVGRLSAMGYPKVELDRFDEWIGPIIKGLPEGTVTKEAVLQQLKNIFPWLELDRMDDIYPVTGKNFSESMLAMREALSELSPNQVRRVFRNRPQLRLAAETANDRTHPLKEFRNQFVIPIIKSLLEMHRSNMEIGYRQIAAFSAGLRRLTQAVEPGAFEREVVMIADLINNLFEKGSINSETHTKLMGEMIRSGSTAMFGDLEFGQQVMDAISDGDQDDVSTFMDILMQNARAATDGSDVPQLSDDQRRFVERYAQNIYNAQQIMGDAFEQHVRSGFYGSVKTIGEAVREMEPFIVATERSRRRRSLLPRYKREVIDPIGDALLSDEDKMSKIPTFNEWLDANGYQELTYDKNDDGGEVSAGMSSLTRTVMARFTDDAASAVTEGYEDSAQSGSPELNLGHLLSGAWRSLMTDINNPASYSSALRRMGITADRMTRALESVTTPKDAPSPRPTGFSKAAQSTMIGAIKAAARRGDEFVDLGDLLQSIFDDSLRGPSSDGVMEALAAENISPNVIRMAIASTRITGGSEPSAGMSASRSTMNSIDKRDDLKRNKLLANGLWFNADRPIPVTVGTATDGELVDEVERLINLYSAAAAIADLSPKDFRGGQSPFSNSAIRITNSFLIHGDNGQEPSDLVGAIRYAMDRADALLTDDVEQKRLSELKSKMRLYFDNDEHMPDDAADPSAGMARNFSDMIQPISDNFGRSEQLNQKRYFEGIYGDADLSESELRKAADLASLGSPLDVSKNLEGNEDDISWSTSEWSFNKDDVYVEAADSVMIRMRNGDISTAEIAMISRKSGPFRDAMALVGGLRDEGEDFMTTAARETAEEVGVSLENASQAEYIGTIEAPDWDPRFVNGARVGAGMFVLPWDTQLTAASDASGARWVPLSEIAAGNHRLAFGHAEWIRRAVAAMRINPSSDPYGDLRLRISRRLGILSKASRVRNQKMIAQVNSIRRATGKKLFPESGDMPHPMMPWGNRVAKSSWKFGASDAEAGMSDAFIDDSLPRALGLMSVQSSMPARLLESGTNTVGFYRVGHARAGDDLFAAWGDKDRVEQLWRPYVDLSIERARRGDTPNDQQRPSVYVLGGASGVGKSASRTIGLAGIPNYDSAVVADPDDAKIMMPEARLWYARRLPGASSLVHAESRQVTAVLARAATKEGLDLVYDTSGQFNDGFQDIRDWRSGGYDIVAHYFFAPESTLQRRVREREEKTGRGVPAGIVSTIQWNVMQMLPGFMGQQLFDELYIWDTEKDPAKPILLGQLMLDQPGQPQVLQVKHPYLFRYLFRDRVGPDGDKLEPRKTQAITIPYSQR